MRTCTGMLLLCAGIGLGACASNPPDSGVGFADTDDSRRARELALDGSGATGFAPVPSPVVSGELVPLPAPSSVEQTPAEVNAAYSGSGADIAAETQAALAATSSGALAPTSVVTAPTAPSENPSISTENDFAAVSEQRTIRDDAALIEKNRQAYTVVEPTEVPPRDGASDPNIVAYALSTSHPRGTRMYSRSGLNLASRAQRNCAGFPSPDQAQIAFLSQGGPERDPKSLDPDGDGYACSWNPEPFRRASG